MDPRHLTPVWALFGSRVAIAYIYMGDLDPPPSNQLTLLQVILMINGLKNIFEIFLRVDKLCKAEKNQTFQIAYRCDLFRTFEGWSTG